MKKTLIASVLISGLGFAAFATSAAPAGTITINGKLTASTCSVKVDDSTNGDATITLPTLSTANLAKSGEVAGATSFVIKMTDCTPATGNVRAYFESGANVDSATGRLNNAATGDSAAKNVQVQLLNDSDVALSAGSDSQRSNAATALAAGAASMTYQAQYYATGTSTPGNLTTAVTYSVDYE